MKFIVVIALGLLIGGGLIWVAKFEPGFVLLQYAGWSLETSLVVFIVAFFLLVIGAYIALHSLLVLKQAPGQFSRWQSRRQLSRANQALVTGLMLLEEGRFSEAERWLMRHVSQSDAPLLHYLSAARAAQNLGATDRRDNYLRLAHEITEGTEVVTGVVQAELQLQANQKQEALLTLQQLRELSPKHPFVIKRLQQLYSESKEWQGVQEILPDIKKGHILASSAVKSLTQEATVGQLDAAIEEQNWGKVNTLWQQAPTKVRHSEQMLASYVRALRMQGRGKEAGPLIEAFMNNQWSDSLAYQYGLIELDKLDAQTERALYWLKKHPDNSLLLLTLGRLFKARTLYEPAERYLRQSLKQEQRGETYQLLAEVLTQQNAEESSIFDIYQEGFSFLLKKPDK